MGDEMDNGEGTRGEIEPSWEKKYLYY